MSRHQKRTIYDRVRLALGFLEFQFLPHYFGRAPKWRIAIRKMIGRRTSPDFALIGPVKGGSSDLVSHLLLHPCVVPPLSKEIYSPDPGRWKPYYPTERQMKRVAGASGAAVSGYLGPFLHRVRLINAFHHANPDAKIIITLRNPVERAYSHWKWEVLLAGKELVNKHSYFRSFSDFVELALDLFPACPMDSVCGFPFLQTGIYHKAVELWINRFGRRNVLVFDIGSYFDDRSTVLDKVQSFLGIPRFRIPELDFRVNANPLSLPPADEISNECLADFYSPHNSKLWTAIDCNFGWNNQS